MLAHSPRIVTDGLVLCLDAANSKGYDRFENLALNSEAINSWANNGNAISVTANSQIAPDGTLTADTLAQTAVTGASRWVSSTTRTYTAGVTYALSIWLKKISGTQAQPTINLWVNGGTNQSVGTITTEWIRYSKSFTPSSTISSNTFSGLNIGWSDSGGANDFVFAAWGFQIEIGSSATDYYRTTSTTKSRGTILGDLSGNGNNGTLQNTPTYDANNFGNFLLDGIDDRILISCNNSTVRTFNSTTHFTIKLPVYSGGQRCILSYRSGAGLLYIGKSSNGIFCYYNQLSTPAFTVGNIAANSTVICSVTCDATNNILSTYINGVLAGSVSRTGWNSTYHTSLYLGWDPGGTNEYMLGNFYQFSHYNRVLTAQEVQQNFNATRGRFGI